jgi:SWI/SNF-related matrix-associated actin-dependent regulator 1 of chromatin subfamily A
MLKPFPFQKKTLNWLSDRPRAIVALEQGLGKTVVASLDAVPPVLIICTNAMKYRWKHELNLWRPDLKVQVIDNVRTEIDWSCNVWIINYDIVWRYALPKPHTLIVDESHKVKNPSAKRTISVLQWVEHAERVRFLSGTPMPNRPIELFPILEKIHEGVGRMGWYGYVRRFCDAWRMPWNNELNVSGASNLEELCDLTSDVMIRLTKAQVAKELPSKTYRIIELDGRVTKREQELWHEFEKANLRLPVNSIPFQAISDIRKEHARRKLPQCVRYIKDLLDEDETKKVVVFAHHRETIETLEEQLNDYGLVKIYGGTNPKDAFDNVQTFQNDGKVRVFVGNIQSAGEGITLTASNHVVFVEPSWVPGEIAQPADRCHRFGQSLPVTVDLLTVQGSIDAQMLWSVLSKFEVINQVVKETEIMDYGKIAELLRALADEFDGGQKGVEEKPKPKAEPKTDEKPTEKAKEVVEEKATKAEDKPEKITDSDVKAAAAAAIAGGHRDAVLATMKEHGASKVSELEESDYPEIVKKLKALLDE